MTPVLLTALIMAAFCLSGCQPTPLIPPVANKRDLEEKLRATPASQQKFDTVQKVTDWFENMKGDLYVEINASVTMPPISEYPVIRAKIEPFSEEFKNKLVDYFIDDKENVYTKELIESKDDLRRHINGAEKLLQEGRETGVWWHGNEEGLLNSIAQYEELLKKAPDKAYYKVEEATTDFVYNENGDHHIKVYQHPDDAYTSLHIYNHYRAVGVWGIRREYKSWNEKGGASEQEKQGALIEAERFLKYLGIEGMVLFEMRPGEAVKTSGEIVRSFELEYKRDIGGTYAADVFPRMVYSEGDYSKVYFTEVLRIGVAEGKVFYFMWVSPVHTVEVMTQNAALMPLEEVIDYAKKYIFYKEYLTEAIKGIRISEIRLNYMRVDRKDHDGEFLYIPVWDFMGYELSKNPNIPVFMAQCMVTVNAIDGSYIDRLKGY